MTRGIGAVACALALLGSLLGCANAVEVRRSSSPSPSASSAVSAAPKPPAKSELAPPNAGFEGSAGKCPEGWSCSAAGSASAALDSSQKHDGAKSLRVSAPTARDRYVLSSQPLPAEPQRQYVTTVWRRSAERAEVGSESIRLIFLDAARKWAGASSQRGTRSVADAWVGLSARADAPAKAAYVQVEVTIQGPSPGVFLDGLSVQHRPILDVWGGTGLQRGSSGDTLVLQFTTPTHGGVHLGALRVMGTRLVVESRSRLSGGLSGFSYRLLGRASYDSSSKTIAVRPGGAAKIVITGGRFAASSGTGFAKAMIWDPVAEAEFPIFVALQNFSSSESPSLMGFASTLLARRAVDRLSAYLDTRMTPSGGWSIAHKLWPSTPREDPLAIADLTEGYLSRVQASSASSSRAQAESKARRGLDWMVRHQRTDGGFGLPWPYGAAQGHYPARLHYLPGHRQHPAGEPYAVLTANAGLALLNGYKVLGDKRYLSAAQKAIGKLLRGPSGFQWLDAARTRGSVPYCDLGPIFNPGHAAVAAHDVVPRLKNTSVEVYNIDGATLSFIAALYEETGDQSLLRYGDALASNLAFRMNPNGSIPYVWYQTSYKSGPYANIVFSGLLGYGELRRRQDWIDKARTGYSWMANKDATGYLPNENYATSFGLDVSLDVTQYLNNAVGTQHPNGSFSGGTATREDAVMFSVLSAMLLDVGG